MLYKNFFQELAFKFSDLSNLKPDGVKSRFNIFDNIVTDDFIYNINPSRYIFYMEFMRALKNPELLKNIIYENKLIKNSRETEAEIIDKIVARMNRLYTDDSLIDKSSKDYRAAKKEKINKENTKLKKRLEKILETYEISEKDAAKGAIAKIFDGGEMIGGVDGQYGQYGQDGVNIGTNTGFNQLQQYQVPYLTNTNTYMPSQQQFQQQQDLLIAPQIQQPSVSETPKLKNTPEKEALELIKKDANNIQERLDNKKGITKADIDILNIFIDELEKLKEAFIQRFKDNDDEYKRYTNDNEYIDTSEKEINVEIARLKALKEKVIEETSKIAQSTREEVEKEINEKRALINEKKSSNETAKNNSNERAKDIREDYEKKKGSPLHYFKGELKKINEKNDQIDIKASKLKDVIDEIENNEFSNIEQLKISKSDRLVFIGVTFLVRLITLVLIDWALNTNYVVSFTQAYVLYVVLYCIFIMLIIVIVNMTYNYPLYKLYNGDHGIFSAIASSMYYFYLIPGNMVWESARFIIHFTLIIFLTVIAIMIKSNETTEDNILNYDYTERKNIRRALSNFTLLLWFFTSVVSMYMF
jgi:hypothetical protein